MLAWGRRLPVLARWVLLLPLSVMVREYTDEGVEVAPTWVEICDFDHARERAIRVQLVPSDPFPLLDSVSAEDFGC